ncbi:Uncharacterized protein APZ42_010041, partial [Daphnia magna]
KKITGSFWIRSFDTVYSQETILITPLECWRMVNDKKCGENNMQTGPTGLLQEKVNGTPSRNTKHSTV